MPAPAKVITFGDASPLYTSIMPQVNTKDFDTISLTAITQSQYSFPKHASIPGFSAKVQTCASRRNGPDWIHDVNGMGLLDGAARLVEGDAEDAESDFDTGFEVWAALSTQSFIVGRAHSDHPNLKCVSAKARKAPVTGYSYFDLRFKGIKSGNRPDKFSFQTMTKETMRKNFIVTLQGGDANTPHDWNLLLATPVLQRQYVNLSRPNATAVGNQGSGSGVNFPATFTIGATDSDLTYQWPNGVVLIGLTWDEIPGTNICFVTEIYVKRDAISLG